MEAVEYGGIATVKYLLAHGANINIRNKDGDTALTLAVDHPKMLAVLNKYRKSLNRNR